MVGVSSSVFWIRGNTNQMLPRPKRVPVITRSTQVLSRKPNIWVMPSQAMGRIMSTQIHQGMPGTRFLLSVKIRLAKNMDV